MINDDAAIFEAIFREMISGDMPDDDICKHLLAWEKYNTSTTHLALAAKILREKMIPIKAPEGAMDIVGTGGDGLKTFNISTAVALVVAGAGVPVAKHGNRAVSSKSGASDVLRELGVKLDITPAKTEQCINEAGIGFLFAPNHHKAMGNVAAARAKLGVRTIFNLLGPLCNPASVQYYLLGVYDDKLRKIYGRALMELGVDRALIVHGNDGMDEVTTTDFTMLSEVNRYVIKQFKTSPERFDFIRSSLKELEGGDAKENAEALLGVLRGEQSPYSDIVVFNAGVALYTAKKQGLIKYGIPLARQSIASGAAMNALNKLNKISNS